jgi:thioredoxin 1
MPYVELTDQSFWNQISEGYVLIMASSPHCLPCVLAKPHLDKISQDNPWLEVYYLDIEKNPKSTNNLFIYSVPSFIFWKKGMQKEINGADFVSINQFIEGWNYERK